MKQDILTPQNMPLGMLINDVSRHIHYTIQMETEKLGIRGAYQAILFHLVKTDGITQLELAKRSHLKPPTISVSLKKMEDDGLVIRKTDPNDMRQVRVYITEKGQNLEEKLNQKIAEVEKVISNVLSEQEQKDLKELLIKIRDYQRNYYNFKGRKSE